MLAEGKANRQIASELGISVRTIELHRSRIMRKFRVRSLAGIVYRAMENGIVARRRSRSNSPVSLKKSKSLMGILDTHRIALRA